MLKIYVVSRAMSPTDLALLQIKFLLVDLYLDPPVYYKDELHIGIFIVWTSKFNWEHVIRKNRTLKKFQIIKFLNFFYLLDHIY